MSRHRFRKTWTSDYDKVRLLNILMKNNAVCEGPRRVTTSVPETRTSPSPRLHFDAKQHFDAKSAATKNRASFDVARQQPSVDLPPRPSLDSSSSRLGRQSNPVSQKLSPRREQQNTQVCRSCRVPRLSVCL